jgi:hypothetical protein
MMIETDDGLVQDIDVMIRFSPTNGNSFIGMNGRRRIRQAHEQDKPSCFFDGVLPVLPAHDEGVFGRRKHRLAKRLFVAIRVEDSNGLMSTRVTI